MKKFIIFMVILILSISIVSYATLEDDIDSVNKKIEESDASVGELQNKIDEEQGKLDAVNRTLEETIYEKKALEARIEKTTKDISKVEKKIDELKVKISAAKKEIKDQEVRYGARLRTMYYKKDETFWTVIFDSKGIEDLLTRISSFKKIADQDEEVLIDLIDKRNELAKLEKEQKNNLSNLEALRSAQEKDKENLIAVEAELERRKEELAAAIAKHQELLNAEQAANDNFIAQKDALLAEAERIRRENAAASGGSTGPIETGTGWIYPAPGTTITYWFGYRVHPLYGTDDWHSGIDMVGNYGDPVYAAQGGLVVQAGWNNWGYGNWVVIDHGGYQTLYGHGSEVLVSVGDVVSQGQQVMAMGSTGTSTVEHLHFSVIVGGEFVDPAPYLGL